MKTIHELRGSCFYKKIGMMILGKRGDDVMKSICVVGRGSEDTFFGDEEKLNC
jgi:hypothetical protein